MIVRQAREKKWEDEQAAGKLSCCQTHGWNFPYGAEARITSGCSKRSSGKAAASEEARRYGPHFVGPFALAIGLGERKSPSSTSDFRKAFVEPLSDASTMHGTWRVLARRGWAGEKSEFFSLLLELQAKPLLRYPA